MKAAKPTSQSGTANTLFRGSSRDRAAAISDFHDLGDSISTHPRLSISRGVWLRRTTLALGLDLAILGYGVWRAYYGYTKFGVAAALAWSRPWLLLAGLGAGLLIFLSLRRVRGSRTQISLHQNGLLLQDKRRATYALPWEDIHGVTTDTVQTHLLGWPLVTRHRLTLHPEAGDPISIDHHVQDVEGLTQQLKERYYAYLSPRLEKQWLANHWIPFGPVDLHRQVLRVLGQRIPWDQVEELRVQSGYLVVELKNGSPIRLSVSDIPNLELLLDLVNAGVTT